MGTQQILLIVLSVIIVGVAVAGGIGMFNQHLEQSNRNGLISDMNLIATQSVAYYRMPTSMGGGGGAFDQEGLITWLNMPMNRNGKRVVTENGTFIVKAVNANKIRIAAYGKYIGNDETKIVRARLVLKGIDSDPKIVIMN